VTGHGTDLRIKIELAWPALHRSARQLWNAPGLPARYVEYLLAMHAVVRASVPLMDTALARCRATPADPVAGPLERYLAPHMAEERGHDDWLCEDIAATGHDPGEALRRVPPAAAAAMVGAQYYWIAHWHPVALLGYIAVLEGWPPHPGLASRLAALTGYPVCAFGTLSRHADADPGHGEEVFRLLDRLPLTVAQEKAVGVSALHTVSAAARLLSEIAGGTPAGRGERATS